MSNEFYQFIHENREKIIDYTYKNIQAVDGAGTEIEMDQQLHIVVSEILDLLQIDNKLEQHQRLSVFFNSGRRLAWPITDVVDIFDAIGISLYELLNETDSNAIAAEVKDLVALQKIIIPLRNRFVTLHVESWETTVETQKLALKELTVPLIPIFDKICVMPLVGTIDTERAKFIIENLLQGTVETQSEIVLIDITAIPVVDTMVAHYLMQAVEALRLVGARAILVGIRPEIAQTIVNLGIQMQDFETESTLQRGVAKALNAINRKIVEVADT
ncbi:modulator protein RsbR [Lysinibacillus alkalisoli]|uniref:Modulator protein RsbR n=1 Tax=Lysinibacillus alkalisoli TaxID=1911548 RepID=A0A917G6F0_9BACI|nr:STAS domain-containing protein [Lysinibacillus alkalisoli]GGG24931.1 modulator protein RsbR [Lysinibacillus alkalisoli]